MLDSAVIESEFDMTDIRVTEVVVHGYLVFAAVGFNDQITTGATKYRIGSRSSLKMQGVCIFVLISPIHYSILTVAFGWIKGASHVKAQWDTAIQQQALQAVATRERQAQATVKVVTEYVDRVRIVREKGDTIIKEVPVYVPVQADAACSINRGFLRLHDAAAAGELPEPARDADAASAGIALSAVAGTVAANYQTCHENAEQLRVLQTWIREMKIAAEQ